jgi:hypothetical protein
MARVSYTRHLFVQSSVGGPLDYQPTTMVSVLPTFDLHLVELPSLTFSPSICKSPKKPMTIGWNGTSASISIGWWVRTLIQKLPFRVKSLSWMLPMFIREKGKKNLNIRLFVIHFWLVFKRIFLLFVDLTSASSMLFLYVHVEYIFQLLWPEPNLGFSLPLPNWSSFCFRSWSISRSSSH